jgi:hypothetical protein
MAAHSFVADKMSKVPPDVTDALRDGRPIPDAKLRALAEFTRIMLEKRGRPNEADAQQGAPESVEEPGFRVAAA